MKPKIVVTRHPALIHYLAEIGLIPPMIMSDMDPGVLTDGGIGYPGHCQDCGNDGTAGSYCQICVHIIAHAAPSDIAGKDVIGVLPLHLAARARSVTEIPMDLPAPLRGAELTLSQVRQFAGKPQIYVVLSGRDGEAWLERGHTL